MPRAARCASERRRAGRAGRAGRGLAAVVLLVGLTAGCSGGSDDDLAVSPQATTGAPVATTALEAGGPDTSVSTAVTSADDVDASCTLTPPPEDGMATVVAGRRLLTADGQCLADLGAAGASRIQWSPDGARVLLDGDRVLDEGGFHASGFLAGNPDVEWSGPKGTSLLAATSDGSLVKRSSRGQDRTDVSFLDQHDSSTYHPAGKAIVALGTGVGESGEPELGVWLATNIGAAGRLLVRDESAAAISEPRFDASGAVLYFLARHAEGVSHVHAYDTSVAELSEALDTTKEISALTVSALSDGAWAVRTGSCDQGPTGVIAAFGSGEPQDVGGRAELRGQALEPAGWLPERRLLVLARPACGEPGTLWQLDADGTTTALATGVDAAAARTVRGIPNELSIPIGAEVVA